MGTKVSGIAEEALLWFCRRDSADTMVREAWRYSGPFTRWNRFKGSFPGLGIATVAFAVYCGYEYMFLQEDVHAEGHGEEHH